MDNGIAFSLTRQAVSQGTLSTQITLPEGVSLLAVRMTVSEADPQAQATAGINISYTDYSGVNPAPATKTLALASVENELDFVIPVTPANGVVSLSFPVTGAAGSYNVLILFK